ncbi:MAG: 2-phospho-L-lactate guanylyltransferase [Microthrixaceae bacterium]
MSGSTDAVVIVPLKSFESAKSRLGGHLDAAQRSDLVRSMAATVLRAAHPLATIVVCDDPAVASFAAAEGAHVVTTAPEGLNAALDAALRYATGVGVQRVTVVPADLPFATDLDRFVGADDELVIVADRHGDGTNLLSFPAGCDLRFAFGQGSFRAHLDEAARLGLTARIVDDAAIAWDVDEPADLSPPPELGTLATLGAAVPFPDDERVFSTQTTAPTTGP